MIGCLNVLSRLKKPGIRIVQPMIDESFVRNSAVMLLSVATAFNREPEENIAVAERGSGGLRYYNDFTARLPVLVNFEQFGGFRGQDEGHSLTEDLHPN